MKKEFEKPELIIIEFANQDIITLSGDGTDDEYEIVVQSNFNHFLKH